MKLILDKNKLSDTPLNLIRGAGYGYIRDRRSGQESFARHTGRNFYPRFHLYIEEEGEKIIFNLHLDQKQPSYSGSHMHNGEYDGEVIEEEMERIKLILNM